VSEEKSPQHPSENGEGAVGPGESYEPQWSDTYEYSRWPETLEVSAGRGTHNPGARLHNKQVSAGPLTKRKGGRAENSV